jgi:hypothetical protein
VSTFAGNSQHTAIFEPAARELNGIRWTTSIDLNNTGAFAHYGAPLITPANTVLVPVKTATDGFQINAFNGGDGSAKYSLSTDYILPTHSWIPTYQPVLAAGPAGLRLYYPGAGGTVYHVDNLDSDTPGAPVHEAFYGLGSYLGNAAAFNSTIFINTPITADSSGDIFFGFRVQGTAPAPVNTTRSGFARIDPNGNATYVLADAAANDAGIGRDSHNSAPALSNDESTLYVVVKGTSTDFGYLLGLDATTLATRYKVFLKDPRNGHANNARILDNSTASPLVAPDGDVYLGIFGNPSNGSRGFLLHFSADLTVEKPPGGFGWDSTPSIVPTGMVPFYTGASPYLLFTKYNNYAGFDGGDGVNKIALLDPNATEVDPHSSSNGLLVMREVATVAGPTPDAESASTSNAVREWCINTAAVNPATGSIFMPSEDGHIYRWNLATNSLSQAVRLTAGIGEPYVPTVIGPDGTVYTLNGGTLFALGDLDGVGVTLTSSAPDVQSVVAGQSLTFMAAVANTGAPGSTPTGTVTFQDTVYFVIGPDVLGSTTTVLAADVPLDGAGRASHTTSALLAANHFITAAYSGDGTFSAGSVTLIQKIHGAASTTTVTSSLNPSGLSQAVTFTATVASAPPGGGTPSGMVTFREGPNVLAQAPLGGSGVASFSTSALSAGSHTITAVYQSDTLFSSSGGDLAQVVGNVPPAPTVTGFSPTSGPVGTSVTINGTNFTGASAVNVNGTSAAFTVNTSSKITATVPVGASTGKVSVISAGGTGTSTGSFTVRPGITGFTPDRGGIGTNVTITGTTLTGATSLRFNGTAATFTVNSSTEISAGVPANATTGPISVTTPGGTAASAASFTVAPRITSFTPGSGAVGASVTINGANFTGTTSVQLNGTPAAFTVNASSKITTAVPAGAVTGRITVATPAGAATSASDFAVILLPTITGLSPGSGAVGVTVTITGTSFTGTTSVRFNGVSAGFTVQSSAQITATVPPNATTGTVSVTNAAGTATSSGTFTVAPRITGFSPGNGVVGASVTINGSNFTGATAVTWNGTSSTFIVNASNKITATVPAGATTGKIGVTTPAGTATSGASFSVKPGITSFTPTGGAVGTSVTITGTTFTGAMSVKFNGMSAAFSVNSTTEITATVPANAITGPISVTTPGGTGTSAANFTVAPRITGVVPASGPAGASVTINGANLTGATSVQFNGTSAPFTVITSSKITATVPAGASTGKITVTTPAGTATSASDFTVS